MQVILQYVKPSIQKICAIKSINFYQSIEQLKVDTSTKYLFELKALKIVEWPCLFSKFHPE